MVLYKNFLIIFSFCLAINSTILTSSYFLSKKAHDHQKEIDKVLISKMLHAIQAHKKLKLRKIIDDEIWIRTRNLVGKNFDPITSVVNALNCLRLQADQENIALVAAKKKNK